MNKKRHANFKHSTYRGKEKWNMNDKVFKERKEENLKTERGKKRLNIERIRETKIEI